MGGALRACVGENEKNIAHPSLSHMNLNGVRRNLFIDREIIRQQRSLSSPSSLLSFILRRGGTSGRRPLHFQDGKFKDGTLFSSLPRAKKVYVCVCVCACVCVISLSEM